MIGWDSDRGDELLKRFSVNLGKKFQECYRKASEDLAENLGVGADARARVLSGGASDADS